MADTSYQPLVYKKQGGDELVVASGGTVTVESGGTIALASGADITVAGDSLIDEVAAMTGLDTTEFGYLNGSSTTVTASKVIVADASKDVATIRNLTISGNLVTGSTTLSEAELGVLDGVTGGTATASKALVLGASSNIDAFIIDNNLKIGGSYSSPVAIGGTGYVLKAYGADATDGSVSVCTFFFLRGTGSTGLIGDSALVEGNSTGGSYPKTLEGGQFMAGLNAGAKLASRAGDATAGMYGAWLKVYSNVTSIIDSGAYTAAVWLDNQHSSNYFSGTEYTIYATAGGTVPDAFIGMESNSSGWDAFVKIEDTGGAMLSDTDQSLATQSGALKVVTPGGTKWIALYNHP